MSRSLAVKAAVVGTLAFAALVAPSSAQAQTKSELNFGGSVNLYDAPGSGGANLFVDFLTNGTGGPPTGSIRAGETISGAFTSSISDGTTGTITDLTISPETVVGMPISPFVQIGGYTFTLTEAADGATFGPITLRDEGFGSSSAVFAVKGTVTGGAFGSSTQMFTGLFTTQFDMTAAEVFNAINTGGNVPTTFSATFVVQQASVVPEPSTYLLLGTGLGALGLVGLRRRRSES